MPIRPLLSCLLVATMLGGMVSAGRAADQWDNDFFWGMDDPRQISQADDTIRLRGGIGMLFLYGDEYVFNGDSTLSHLKWDSRMPVLRGSVDLDVGHGVSVRAEGSVAGLGSSYMEDYDWMIPTNNFDDWTHRSQHPDTQVDHYFTGALSLGYELARQPDAVVRLHGGLKYTDVQWSAQGGSYIYSVNGFRDTVGSIPDGVPAITYRQQLPELFLGFDGDQRYGNIRLGGLLRGGVTFLGRAHDDHWLRDLRIEDSFLIAPAISVGADMGLALGRNAELFIAARYDQAFQMRGRAVYTDTVSNQVLIAEDDIAGAGLRGIEVSAGLTGKF